MPLARGGRHDIRGCSGRHGHVSGNTIYCANTWRRYLIDFVRRADLFSLFNGDACALTHNQFIERRPDARHEFVAFTGDGNDVFVTARVVAERLPQARNVESEVALLDYCVRPN